MTENTWTLYQSRAYADLWYSARSAGERVRARALERLYRNRPRPGGLFPDPRKPSAFSNRAVLAVAASLLHLQASPIMLHHFTRDDGRGGVETTQDPEIDLDEETGQTLPYAWIATYPREARRPPEIILRSVHADHARMEHAIACLLGYWDHDYARLADPAAPPGTILLPRDPGMISLLHQYAIALLCLEEVCPPSWLCHCNAIRARFNAPPPDHDQPTGTFTVEDLRAAERRRNTEPRFPYPDRNSWAGQEEP